MDGSTDFATVFFFFFFAQQICKSSSVWTPRLLVSTLSLFYLKAKVLAAQNPGVSLSYSCFQPKEKASAPVQK